jgi:hypothetical protein
VDFLIIKKATDDVSQARVYFPKVLSPKKWGYVEEDDYEEGESDYNFAH